MCTPEKMKVNSELLLSLIETIVRDMLLASKADDRAASGGKNFADRVSVFSVDKLESSKTSQQFF